MDRYNLKLATVEKFDINMCDTYAQAFVIVMSHKLLSLRTFRDIHSIVALPIPTRIRRYSRPCLSDIKGSVSIRLTTVLNIKVQN
jgi:hypothetical protein